MMLKNIILCIACFFLTTLSFIHGKSLKEAGSCESEQGECTWDIYENVRLRALKSSGCTKFCQCEYASTEADGSLTYRWAEHSCPAGLLFDENIKVCNWPQEVQCRVNNLEDCEMELGKCTKFIYEVTRLRALKSSGCTKFCQCEHASTEADGSVTYRWAEHTCAPGLLFDEDISVCNWPSNVQCNANDNGVSDGEVVDDGQKEEDGAGGDVDNGNVIEDCEAEHGECTKYVYENVRLVALKSSGCTKFCQCEYASTEADGSVTYRWAEHLCPSGLLFDEQTAVCNWPQNVQCDGDGNNGGTDNGGVDNGGTDSGENDNGGTDNGGTDNGGPDNGGTDNGGSDNGETDNDGIDNGGTENGGDNNSGTENGGDDNNGADGNGDGNGDNGFECYKCYKSDSNKDCNKNIEICDQDKEICQTRMEWYGDEYKVWKGCVDSDSSSSEDESDKSSKKSSSKSSSSDNSDENSSEESSDDSSGKSRKSSKSSKEKSAKSSKEKSSKSSKEKSAKSSKEKSSKSSKEKSGKSSKSASSSGDFSGCKKRGKKITCQYECTSSLCNEFLPPLDIE